MNWPIFKHWFIRQLFHIILESGFFIHKTNVLITNWTLQTLFHFDFLNKFEIFTPLNPSYFSSVNCDWIKESIAIWFLKVIFISLQFFLWFTRLSSKIIHRKACYRNRYLFTVWKDILTNFPETYSDQLFQRISITSAEIKPLFLVQYPKCHSELIEWIF